MDFLFYVFAGAGVGLAVGVTGVGGGSLMTPLLILFGIPLHIAIGTDLLYASLTKASGVYAHAKQGSIRWRLVLLLAAGSIPGALITTYFLDSIFANASAYESVLTSSLGGMLVATSLVLFFKSKIQSPTQAPSVLAQWFQKRAQAVTVIAGLLLGVFVTLSSVGAGAFCAVLLLLLYPRLPALQVIGTDIAHAVPLTLIAGLGHLTLSNPDAGTWVVGNVDFQLLGCLLLGSLPAVHIGTKLGARLPSRVLQSILASVLMVLGAKFLLF
jgi:uncharacterized membrane protein YfcA|tara:strand:+ start:932 stop:1741 length:810 start_codon:yes stop_codon:yes gene_type:complete